MLVNGGFESGGLAPGWSLDGGVCQVTSGTEAFAGSFLLGPSNPQGVADCRIHQDVDLVGANFRVALIDGGWLGVSASAALRSVLPPTRWDDKAFLRLRFLDAQGDERGSLRTLLGGGDTWSLATATGRTPPGTRLVRIEIEARHRLGGINDGRVDDASLRFLDRYDTSPPVPQITKLPFLQDVRRDAMTILWETDINPPVHAVDYGPMGSGLIETVDRVETTQVSPDHFVHKAVVKGLATGADYVYRVRSGETTSATYSFRTAPPAARPFRVVWFSDNQSGPSILSQHVPRIAARQPDLVMVPGDHVQNGAVLSGWDTQWFEPMSIASLAQTVPVMIARGNHDSSHAYSYAYSALPGNEAWYAFAYGNTFFVVLDTEAPTSSPLMEHDQRAFLAAALDSPEATSAEFRVVSFHKPPYTNLWDESNLTKCVEGNPYTGQPGVRSDWIPLFESKGVDLVVAGHTHSYQHGVQNGVHYLLVGGGGGTLDTVRGCSGSTFWDFIDTEASVFHYNVMDVDGATLRWAAYDLSDRLVHSLEIRH